MKKVILASVLFAAASTAMAGPQCTEGKNDNWISEQDMQARIAEMGYEVKKFKVSKGNCYEIYGWDKEGRKVEVYFHPETGEVVKSEIED
ncbi:hypothetical protein SAMN05421831_110120 [Allopseudospirillum japonicum]|uniref:PepSY domain-containing protein n=1 Tax=Allopseudospirillum japonicum TaxID=64971 RepID=A0A1H6TWB1_9GAMM|nr:PepSY domain-containing protein [Allopseudospirillum japonicum]SEI80032.1 hypothetical protein SAMN05421831_110120 [Allopseudospirillum japonicum]